MQKNGLVANPKKMVFMLLNDKSKQGDKPITIKVGSSIIPQEKTTKLLGLNINDNQGWTEQFFGKKGLINSLNQRLYAIKRISNHIPKS